MTNIRYVKAVSTEMVFDDNQQPGNRYIGDVWHDDEQSAMLGLPYWNINNGTTYLWGFNSREAAVSALIGEK